MTITNLCPIARYEGPQWLIQPQADEWNETPDDGIAEVIAQLRGDEEDATPYRVLESDVRGWGQHTHIIRITSYWGEWDYLATIEDA